MNFRGRKTVAATAPSTGTITEPSVAAEPPVAAELPLDVVDVRATPR